MAVAEAVAKLEAMSKTLDKVKPLCFKLLQVANNITIVAVIVFLVLAIVVFAVVYVIVAILNAFNIVVTHVALSIPAAYSVPLTILAIVSAA